MIISIMIVKENEKKNFEVFTFDVLQNGNPGLNIKENDHYNDR
jgi:hypothetical protein